MFKNYLTVALRNLLRYRLYSAINLLGLAVGISCCILALLFVLNELNYDRNHLHADHIYRVIRKTNLGQAQNQAFRTGISGAFAPAVKQAFPEVEHAIRLWYWEDVWTQWKEKGFQQRFVLADAEILNVFTFPFIKGDPKTALISPGSILLTESMAVKYFGDTDPIGQPLEVDNTFFGGTYTITGILQDIPNNTTLQFDFLTATPQSGAQSAWEKWRLSSSWRPVQVYLQLAQNTNPKTLESKLPTFRAQHADETRNAKESYHLQPLTRIHLYSMSDYGLLSIGDIRYVYLFMAIACFVLLIACINFMNLTTARSTNRAREVGMRKIVGANKQQLRWQFLGESALMAAVALLIAIAFTELVLPAFNAFIQKNLALSLQPQIVLGLLGITLLIGFLSGSYPAFFLAAFQPLSVLRGLSRSGSRAGLRKGLVVFQFTISIILTIGTAVIYKQLFYVQNKDLGFNKTVTLVAPIFFEDRTLNNQVEAVKASFLQHPNIIATSASYNLMGWLNAREAVRPEGKTGSPVQMDLLRVDADFISAYEISITEGRDFSKNFASDSTQAFLLNQTAAKRLGWTNPIGKQFAWGNRRGTVIGVVKDFHMRPLREPIEPVAICIGTPKYYNFLSVRIRDKDVSETLTFLQKQWRYFIPNKASQFEFVDQNVAQFYITEIKLSQFLGGLSLIAIFVACLGLFGLAAFTAEQRTKEIGVRKVLGATISGIVLLLSKDFLKLIAIAALIAWPIAHSVMNYWLQTFAYRTALTWPLFAFSGLLTLTIALTTVGYQAIKAARTNPIEALRHE